MWSSLMGLSLYVSVQINYSGLHDSLMRLLYTYFLGGLIAWPLAITILVQLRNRVSTAFMFIVAMMLLVIFTIGITSLLYALQYRAFFAQWHQPLFTRIWFFQQLFTTLGALFQFAVIGTRLYLPLAPIALVATSYILCRRIR